MPLISWTSKIRGVGVSKQRLLVALRGQNYEAIDEGESISARMPRTLSDFIKNGVPLFLVDHILIKIESQQVRQKIIFRNTVVGLTLACITTILAISLSGVAAQDFAKALFGFSIVIPLGIFITLAILISTVKRDVKTAIKAADE